MADGWERPFRRLELPDLPGCWRPTPPGNAKRARTKSRGMRCVVWVHLVGMRVTADQGPNRQLSPRAEFWVLKRNCLQ